MGKKTKTYIRKPSGQVYVLTAAKFPILNEYLLTLSDSITKRIDFCQLENKVFEPKTIAVPPNLDYQIRKELGIPMEYKNSRVEVCMDSTQFILVILDF